MGSRSKNLILRELVMNNKENNIKIFKDTLLQISKSKQLQKAVKNSTDKQFFLASSTTLPPIELNRFTEPANIIVSKNSSFNAARKYKNVCVLNFASATNPGGGVDKGSSAQEECLCRCSTLYLNLNTPYCKEKFYTPHKEHGTPLHNDDIIYTPDVVIIKSDSYNNLFQHHKVNVITCAAPNLRETPANAYNHENGEGIKISNDELHKLHEQRAERILNVSALTGNENLVLGAFGCGAFRNPPEVVAMAYKQVIEKFKYTFKTIEFAVYCGKDDTNYQVFNKVLGV